MTILAVQVNPNTLTLLEIIQAVCNELSLPPPASVIGNQDTQVTQLLALANREGQELYRRASQNQGWPVLRQEYTFTFDGLTEQACTFDGSNVITGIASTLGVSEGWQVLGTDVPANTRVQSVDSLTQITMTNPTDAVGSGTVSFVKDYYTIPSDWAYFINATGWDRAMRWRLLGPLDPQEWQVVKSALIPTGPRTRFRIMNGLLWFDPVPVGNNAVFEYYSKGWCSDQAGVPHEHWEADTDIPVLVDQLFILGLKWRFLRAKGLDYDEEKQTYERAVDTELARSGAARDLSLNSTQLGGVRLLSTDNIPDTGVGVLSS